MPYLNQGAAEVAGAMLGTGYTPLSAANAYLHVGNGTAAYDKTHTALQGGSTASAGMDPGYPQLASGAMVFQSTFASSAANFAWEEIGFGTAAKLYSRKLQSFGTKPSGVSWTVRLSFTPEAA